MSMEKIICTTLLIVFLLESSVLAAAKEKEKQKKPSQKSVESSQTVEDSSEAGTIMPAIPKIPKAQPNIIKPPSIPKPLPPVTAEDSIRVQKQIKDIIKVHEQLKLQYQEQASEIQRITEQAKIHQKILKDLEQERKKIESPVDAKEILRQEKIRMIIQETQKNQSYINGLNQKEKIQKTQ